MSAGIGVASQLMLSDGSALVDPDPAGQYVSCDEPRPAAIKRNAMKIDRVHHLTYCYKDTREAVSAVLYQREFSQ